MSEDPFYRLFFSFFLMQYSDRPVGKHKISHMFRRWLIKQTCAILNSLFERNTVWLIGILLNYIYLSNYIIRRK